MSGQLFLLGTAIIFITVVFHVLGLISLAAAFQRVSANHYNVHKSYLTALLLAICVFGILLIHIVEAWAWALVYLQLGEFDNIEPALYFSVVTSTTLGYGDLTLSDQWRLLSTFEAMGGLILFGASTAFFIGLMRHLFDFDN